ncbi:MAG: hypothetical protein E7167_00770 [Firmicutes bacterium]|nr:hypothetical protein [Bacillota bacterium]
MKRVSGTLIFCGIVLIIGPFFGFTIRGQQDLDYGSSFLLGIISLVVGLLLKKLCINKQKNVDEEPRKTEERLKNEKVGGELTKEEIMLPMLIATIMEENPEYFLNSYYYFYANDSSVLISDVEGVFEDVSPQLLCLKLVHNIAMMSAFSLNFIQNTGATIENPSSREKKLFLKLAIRPENVDILEREGFGLLEYNNDDMAYALSTFYLAIQKYLEGLSEEKTFLERVLKECRDMRLITMDINTAMMEFIKNNTDFYEKEINKVEQILAEEEM